ncbi:class IIb bacteriocin, lactobin A/cerein 7B family [Riemerella anatipestifer]|uniref:class IIb bacteriocin, lactobin A/cerein 7B family n=1 Tax=Riemerella anatipestifer TaxID=34085 RepID=UPI002363AA6A|nr:class IIb bacteriocin, lactobin A/cerein 7B family [Riemerella anatipestifer]MDD1539442.1 class IIb bacteriocin, lactobin A/cerein 7B family [Riemerella anatipestifer]
MKNLKEMTPNEMREIQGGGILGKLLGMLAGVIYNCGDSPTANPYAPHRKI